MSFTYLKHGDLYFNLWNANVKKQHPAMIKPGTNIQLVGNLVTHRHRGLKIGQKVFTRKLCKASRSHIPQNPRTVWHIFNHSKHVKWDL